MSRPRYDEAQLKDLRLQMMKTELGGEQASRAARGCALNEDLKKEWQEYLDQTLNHQNVVRSACEALGIDADEPAPSQQVVHHIGSSLVKAMALARQGGDPAAAQLVACECVVHAETKDHANWEWLGKVAEAATGPTGKVLQEAHTRVEKDEDHHLYHTQGWWRELWIERLGLPAVLPPPEEVKQVETAIGASRAEQQRERML